MSIMMESLFNKNCLKEKGLTVIIPCYNEQESIPKFFPELITYCKVRNWYSIVLNDGSTNGINDILHQYSVSNNNFEVHSHKLNKGCSAAIKSGIRAATTNR